MERFDVLVVGLGPAGGAAAGIAAKAGLKVLGVDRKQEVGLPVQCAEFIPLPLSAYAQFPGVQVQQIAAMKSYLQSGEAHTADFRGLMIDRAAFDRALVKHAMQHGAQILQASKLVGLDVDNGCAELVTLTGNRTVSFRLLIAADGPYSSVAALLGLPAQEVVHTRQYGVTLLQPRDTTEVWLSERYSGGYAWLFPKGSMANLGIGIDKAMVEDLKAPLDSLHRQLIAEKVLDSEILSRTGGVIPVGGLRQQVVIGHVLFAGDAAGLTHPISGAGIAPAVVSGELAGKACVEHLSGKQEALQEYESELRDIYEAPLQHAVAKRHWMKTRWQSGKFGSDKTQRHSWIAFPEYYAA